MKPTKTTIEESKEYLDNKYTSYRDDLIYHGTQLKRYRTTYKLTQKRVAKHCGHSQSHISKVENGLAHLTLPIIKAYHNAMLERLSECGKRVLPNQKKGNNARTTRYRYSNITINSHLLGPCRS